MNKLEKVSNITLIKTAFLFVVFCNAVVDVAHKVLLQNIAFKVFDGSEQVIWISIINAMIIIPFLLLFTLSGYLSDKYNKKDILIYGAVSSFSLSVLMIVAYISGNFYFAMLSLVLLAVQSAIYSPAKFGIIIDIYGKKNLAKGNSALQAVSIVAILFSIAVASYVFENYYNANNLATLTTKEQLLDAILPLTYYILPVAFLEMSVSWLLLRKLKVNHTSNSELSLDKKDLVKGKLLKNNIKTIASNDVIFLSVIGLSVFWGISQGLMAVFPSFAKAYLNITDVFVINGVIAASGVGIAIGSVLYSKISRYYIEVGTIPLAAAGMAVCIYLATIFQTPFLIGLSFLFFGIFGGMFVVPLNSLIQFNANQKILGTILAGNNWFHSLAMFLMLCTTTVVSFYKLDPQNTIYLILFITILGTIYTIYQLPQSLILLFLKFIVGLKYKLEVVGVKNIPANGGILLLGNHVSWIDWAVVLMSSPREVRFVIDRTYYNKWYLKWILKMFKAIPISNASSKSSIQTIAQELDNGYAVVLFPEGAITRNGHLGEFKKGFEKVLELTNSDIKIVPFYIRGLWESMFSRASKRVKEQNKTNSVTVTFGKTLKKENANIVNVKQDVVSLSTKSLSEHVKNLPSLSEVIFDKLNEQGNRVVFADSTGVNLSANRFLTASILFSKKLKTKIKTQNVGLLLPSTTAGAFMNYSMLLLGKTVVNLNYTAEINSLKISIKEANIGTIISSKSFVQKLEKRGIKLQELFEIAEVVYLEDIKKSISKLEGLRTLLAVLTLPKYLLKELYLKRVSKNDTALILFSSGSEGKPKGVMLSGDNILGNAVQISNLINPTKDDIIVGSLPQFHAFGIVVTTFLPLIDGIKCVAHPDPTDGFGLGKLVAKHKATIMCGTSTFFRLYTKNSKVNPLMFESLRLVIAGAEKLREDVAIDFKKKFGKDILQGYGTTETSPVASCNLPDTLAPDFSVQIGHKPNSVGMPIPGTTVKIVDPNTYEELKVDEEGMVLIGGIQVMKGYLNDEEKTKEVIKYIDDKAYYITGDKGKIDKDGFLTIVDRYSRFAKIGGEMISLGAIEQKLSHILEQSANSKLDYMTTSLEDEKKGEKIILLITEVDEKFVSWLKDKLIEEFDNKLMIPSQIKIVKEIPKLGSGKKDFKAAKILASQE